MTPVYLSYWHRRNLPQVQVAINSLRRFDQKSWILGVADDECYDDSMATIKGERISIDRMSTIESECRPELPWGDVQRSPRDRAWTMQACLPYCFLRMTGCQFVVYFDSDVQFLQPFQPIIDAMPPQAFVALSEHHYPPGRENKSAGRFNNGLMIWRNTPEALAFARGWGERSIAEMSPDKGYEQGELTGWPELLGDKCWIMPKGCNVGPWRRARITGNPPCLEDGTPVQSYHAHEWRPDSAGNNPVTLNGRVHNRTNYDLHPETIESIYVPYETELAKYL